jgi:tetratricopeptide (TPR) repeat protein
MTEDHRPKKDGGDLPKSPPTLVPPDATAGEKPAGPSRTTPLLILACGLLLIIVALLVLFLPLREDKPTAVHQTEPQVIAQPSPQGQASLQVQAPTQTQPTPLEQPSQQMQTGLNDDSAKEINQLMGVWLQKQAEAEAVNITAWGGDVYAGAVFLAKECDRLLGDQQYLAARKSCEEAIENLDDLMASKDVMFEQAVAAGLLAIEQGDPETATDYFQRSLAIDADDERATTGARRAEQLPAVLRFLKDGLTMEKAGDPEGALLAFTEAAALDPGFVPAQEALARVRAEIAEKAFQQAMSRALQAVAEGKPSAARKALQKAESIRPGDRAVRDLKQQLARTQLANRLTALRQQGERLEKEERWPEALKSCEEALSLDSHAAFAASCKERVSLRVTLDRRLKTILAKPERLFEDGPLEEARQALAYALGVTPRGSILTSQISQIERLVTQAEIEVEVVILSDGQTDIMIYHVGRLGVFQEKKIILRTGDYTATGSRNGFRDVRQTLKVRPASGKRVFTLRCEEPI